jgi:hypothetical protein
MQLAGGAATRPAERFVPFGIAGALGTAVSVNVGAVQRDAVPVDLVTLQALQSVENAHPGAVLLPFR